MNHTIPFYVEQRIREIPPANMNIVNGSIPIVAFGNPHNCRVATIGINPSKNEFLDKSGKELTGDKRRLETLNSLGIKSIDGINKLQVRQIWEACNNYFHKNPYYWFNKLQKILKHFEVSYYQDTACHLDLVQWATDPVWGKIHNKVIKDRLIENDRIFLRKQIENEKFEILLLNGRTVINEFQKTFDYCLDEYAELEESNNHRKLTCKIYYGNLYNKIKVIGLNQNLQSYQGLTNTFIETIAKTVSSL